MCQLCHMKLRPADVRRPEAQRRRSSSAPRAAGSSTTSLRCPSSRRSRDRGRPAAPPHPHRRRQPGQPRRRGLRRPRHDARTARAVAELYGYLGRATNNVAEYQALHPRPALRRSSEGAARRSGVLRLRAGRAPDVGGVQSQAPRHDPAAPRGHGPPAPLREGQPHPRAPRAEPRRRRARQPGPRREGLEARPRRRGRSPRS